MSFRSWYKTAPQKSSLKPSRLILWMGLTGAVLAAACGCDHGQMTSPARLVRHVGGSSSSVVEDCTRAAAAAGAISSPAALDAGVVLRTPSAAVSKALTLASSDQVPTSNPGGLDDAVATLAPAGCIKSVTRSRLLVSGVAPSELFWVVTVHRPLSEMRSGLTGQFSVANSFYALLGPRSGRVLSVTAGDDLPEI